MNTAAFTRSAHPEPGMLLRCEYTSPTGLQLCVSADAWCIRLARWEPDSYHSQRLSFDQAAALAAELLACVAAHAAADPAAPGRA
ncbi:hypothetical protein [Comamonas badia]|uniref:hypothetical protein n=1 Tax=Comamonas badia TaxID=265291 RepID=UPI0003F5D14D|nr:hypothetical protein [Comamonas badia]